MKLDAFYQVTASAQEEVALLRLTAVEWLLFEALSTPVPCLARAVAAKLGLDPVAAAVLIGKLQAVGLISEPVLSLEEYRAQFGPAPAVVPAPTVAEPATVETLAAPASPVEAAAEGRPTVSLTMKRSPKAGPRPPKAAVAREIQPLVDLVRKRSGGGALGDLAVYQMFLQVPLPMLEGAGFQPVLLESSALRVEDPILMETLRVSACQVLGIPRHALDPLVG